MCSGVVILGLVLALALAQEMQDNRPQYLIHTISLTNKPTDQPHIEAAEVIGGS